MSLINKMLQDLEERGPETGRSDSLYSSVRLAPVRRAIHPAWLIAAAATVAFLLALGGFSWHKMRSRIIEIPLIVQQAQLPLKMADQLSIPVNYTTPHPEEKPVQSSPVGPVAVGSAETASPGVNQPMKADAESVKPDDVSFRPSSTSGNLSVRLSSDTAFLQKKTESTASEERREPDRHSISTAEQPKDVSVAAVRPSANDLSALTAAKKVRELSPHEKAENEYRKAGGLIQQGHPDEAAAALEQALVFDPRHIGARQVLIGLLIDAKRIDDAMAKAREGLTLDSAQTGLAIILARLQLEKGDLQAAIDTLQHSLPSGTENAEYLAFYAALMQRSGNHKEAIVHYETALRAMPQNGVWWMGMAISLQAEERLADAQNAYMRAKSSGNLSPALVAFVDQRLAQLKR